MFRALDMQPTNSVMRHYLLDILQEATSSGDPWHARVQRSHSLVACFVEMLCGHRGILLEFGCGTVPLLRSCLSTGRACVSLDSDESIISAYVCPMITSSQNQRREEASTSLDVEDEGDRPLGGNPFDD